MRRCLPSLAALAGLCLSFAASAGEPDPKTVRTWKTKCASCHGVDGKAATDPGKKLGIPDFTTAEWKKKVSPDTMKKSISEGLVRPGKTDGMEPYKDKLTPDQIDELVTYVRELK
jgi:mono/diheme cytochrome c family protein